MFQTTYKNISIGGTIIKEKGLHIAVCVVVDNFTGSSDCFGGFKMKHNIVYGTLGGEGRSIDPD
jgi:hypothetical protein